MKATTPDGDCQHCGPLPSITPPRMHPHSMQGCIMHGSSTRSLACSPTRRQALLLQCCNLPVASNLLARPSWHHQPPLVLFGVNLLMNGTGCGYVSCGLHATPGLRASCPANPVGAPSTVCVREEQMPKRASTLDEGVRTHNPGLSCTAPLPTSLPRPTALLVAM